MEFKSAYNTTRQPITFDPEEGRTEQSHTKTVDVNNIIKKYQRTGVLEHRNDNRGRYGSVTVPDFQAAMDTIANANSMFEELPAHIKAKFNYEPTNFLTFVQDDKNLNEMVELGLAHNNADTASQTTQIAEGADPLPKPDPKPDPQPDPQPVS